MNADAELASLRRANEALRSGNKALHRTVRRAVWFVWNRLDEDDPSPVKRIAAELHMRPADVAAIVYADAPRFGEWNDDQEPPLAAIEESDGRS